MREKSIGRGGINIGKSEPSLIVLKHQLFDWNVHCRMYHSNSFSPRLPDSREVEHADSALHSLDAFSSYEAAAPTKRRSKQHASFALSSWTNIDAMAVENLMKEEANGGW